MKCSKVNKKQARKVLKRIGLKNGKMKKASDLARKLDVHNNNTKQR